MVEVNHEDDNVVHQYVQAFEVQVQLMVLVLVEDVYREEVFENNHPLREDPQVEQHLKKERINYSYEIIN